MGMTVFGNANGTAGNSNSTLSFPWCVTVNTDNSMLITDMFNSRVLHVYANASTGVVVAATAPYLQSRRALFDASLVNLFVIDSGFCLMTRYYNGSLVPSTVFGYACGKNLTQFNGAASFWMDSAGNFYVADNTNHRVMFWAINATSGVLLAGITNVSGNDTLHLRNPEDVTFDEGRQFLYVADTNNHRIVQYHLGSSNGTVVAGGNGPGIERK